MKAMTPSAVLAAVDRRRARCRAPKSPRRSGTTSRRTSCRTRVNKRNINADDKLKAVFGGKKQGLDVRDDQARLEPPEVAAAHDPRTRVAHHGRPGLPSGRLFSCGCACGIPWRAPPREGPHPKRGQPVLMQGKEGSVRCLPRLDRGQHRTPGTMRGMTEVKLARPAATLRHLWRRAAPAGAGAMDQRLTLQRGDALLDRRVRREQRHDAAPCR